MKTVIWTLGYPAAIGLFYIGRAAVYGKFTTKEWNAECAVNFFI